MPTEKQLIDALRKSGMRITVQRTAICKMLVENKSHPTAAMIYDAVRQTHPTISLMTVYNTINTLGELGLINYVGQIGDGKAHYDGNTATHINLACISCNSIIDVPFSEDDHFDQELGSKTGYKLVGARIMYYGVCPDCQQPSA